MSALGQKQTFAVQKGMSALPPKADIQQRAKYRTSKSYSIALWTPSNNVTGDVS